MSKPNIGLVKNHEQARRNTDEEKPELKSVQFWLIWAENDNQEGLKKLMFVSIVGGREESVAASFAAAGYDRRRNNVFN